MKKRRYDLEMIQDFPDHLLWEVRITHYEHTTPQLGTTNPELVDQLQKYQKKYHLLGLLFFQEFDKDLPTEAANEAAMHRFRRQQARKRQEQLAHLEALQEQFQEVLVAAEHPHTAIRVVTKASAVPEEGSGVIQDTNLMASRPSSEPRSKKGRARHVRHQWQTTRLQLPAILHH